MTEEETTETTEEAPAAPEGAPAEGMNVPGNLLYAETDEWAKIEGNLATIGITDYAQNQLGDIVGIEISTEAGTTLTKGDAIGVIESVKAVEDFHTPVSGTVKEVNPLFTGDEPDLDSIKNDAYSAWFIKVELSDPAEKDILLTSEAYKDKIK